MRTRLGGEISSFVDQLGKPVSWQPDWLPFTNGRSALAWVISRRQLAYAVVCAYTCPKLLRFLDRRHLKVIGYDVGATPQEIATIINELTIPALVLVPALFGRVPWFELPELMALLTNQDHVVVLDAAQTAFGHIDFARPPGGGVLSCPRKSTSLAEGAVLAVGEEFGTYSTITELEPALEPMKFKNVAKALWALDDPKTDRMAVQFNDEAERLMPETPCRMTGRSVMMLQLLDRSWHATMRAQNFAHLGWLLGGRYPIWRYLSGTPFCLPVFVTSPSGLLADLHRQRIYATRLWPNIELDASATPNAAWIRNHLVCLPIDQRHSKDDMDYIAKIMLKAAIDPPDDVPGRLYPLLDPPEEQLNAQAQDCPW